MIQESPRRCNQTQKENSGSETLASLCCMSSLEEEALAVAYSHEGRHELGREPSPRKKRDRAE